MSGRRFLVRTAMVLILPFSVLAAVLLRIWIEVRSIPKFVYWDVRMEIDSFKSAFRKGTLE